MSLSDIQYTSCGNTLHSSLLSLGTGVIRQQWVVLLLWVLPGGIPLVSLCVRVHRKGRIPPLSALPLRQQSFPPHPHNPPNLPVLTCTLTYSWSRFGDTKIKAFHCFSLSLLSSFSSVTRALSAGALAVHIESSFKLTQPLFTSAL